MIRMARGLGALTCTAGLVLVARPGQVARAVSRGTPPEARIVRLLGARMLLQGALLAARPDRRLAAACAAVDGTHAASMVAAAVLLPRYRRAALLSAGVAVGSAAVSAMIAGRPHA